MASPSASILTGSSTSSRANGRVKTLGGSPRRSDQSGFPARNDLRIKKQGIFFGSIPPRRRSSIIPDMRTAISLIVAPRSPARLDR